MTDLFGQALAPASLSAPPAAAVGMKTSATYGRHGTGSSASAALQLSMASRLQALTDGRGSTLYSLTWKTIRTPSRRRISQLQALAPRTSASASTSSGWSIAAGLAGWPTPMVSRGDYSRDHGDPDKPVLKLAGAVQLAGWPTPVSTELGNTLENYRAMKANMASGPREAITHPSIAAQLASWATPAARDYRHANAKTYSQRGGGAKGEQLNNQAVHLAGWTTPQAGDSRRGVSLAHAARQRSRGNGAAELTTEATLARWSTTDGPARLTSSGELLTGSSARMDAGGQLKPAFSRWLMALPSVWDHCAPHSPSKSKG